MFNLTTLERESSTSPPLFASDLGFITMSGQPDFDGDADAAMRQMMGFGTFTERRKNNPPGRCHSALFSSVHFLPCLRHDTYELSEGFIATRCPMCRDPLRREV